MTAVTMHCNVTVLKTSSYSERLDGESNAISIVHPQMPLAGVVAGGLELAPVLPVVVAAACPRLGPIAVVQTLELLDIQGGEDGVACLSHCHVLR